MREFIRVSEDADGLNAPLVIEINRQDEEDLVAGAEDQRGLPVDLAKLGKRCRIRILRQEAPCAQDEARHVVAAKHWT